MPKPRGTKNFCNKCKKEIPGFIIHNSKRIQLTERKYCLNCSPYRSYNGQKYLYNALINEDGIKLCKACKNPYTKSGALCTTCYIWYKRYIRRMKAINYLGGKCKHCGCADQDCLTFHHLDRSEKEFTIGENFNTSDKKLKIEINKCILLCANCHHKYHLTYKKYVIDYYNKNKLSSKYSIDYNPPDDWCI